jgi:Transposase DDE domain group 1
VTNMSRPAENVVSFYNKRGTCEQWIKEGKDAIKWTRLSCRSFAANAVRLQLHAQAYNLGNFLRTLATPEPIKDWSLTSLKEKLIKIGAKAVIHGRYVAFQMAEVAISRNLFGDILRLIARRLIQRPRETFGCYAFTPKPGETCVLIGTQSADLGIRAGNLAYGTGFVRRRMGGLLPKRTTCANLAINPRSSGEWRFE